MQQFVLLWNHVTYTEELTIYAVGRFDPRVFFKREMQWHKTSFLFSKNDLVCVIILKTDMSFFLFSSQALIASPHLHFTLF